VTCSAGIANAPASRWRRRLGASGSLRAPYRDLQAGERWPSWETYDRNRGGVRVASVVRLARHVSSHYRGHISGAVGRWAR
jgi:hypothetical protein